MTNPKEQEIKERFIAKGKELGLHLGYANKLEELADWWLKEIDTLLHSDREAVREGCCSKCKLKI